MQITITIDETLENQTVYSSQWGKFFDIQVQSNDVIQNRKTGLEQDIAIRQDKLSALKAVIVSAPAPDPAPVLG